jgi:molybdopterin-synthase adenylyltransferase
MESPTDRQERIKWWRQDLLREAHIGVMGAGALGNEVLKNLALVGVGKISIFDFDRIDVTNISRTVLFRHTDVGSPKAAVAASRTRDLSVNPHCSVDGYDLDIVWELGDGYLRRLDLVLGCLDNVEVRLRLGEACYRFGIPYIDGGMRGLGGLVQLHMTGQGACMSCTIGEAERLQAKRRYSCSQVMKAAIEQEAMATVQTTSALIAAVMCQETLKHLHGRPVPFGHFLIWSGDRTEFDNTSLQRFDSCPICQVQPPAGIRELPISCNSTVAELFACAPDVPSFRLPADYITALKCSSCGARQWIEKPAFRCKDTEMSCDVCNSYLVNLERRETIDHDMPSTLSTRQLSGFGVPPLAILFPTHDFQTAAYELSADAAAYPCLRS